MNGSQLRSHIFHKYEARVFREEVHVWVSCGAVYGAIETLVLDEGHELGVRIACWAAVVGREGRNVAAVEDAFELGHGPYLHVPGVGFAHEG